MQHHTIIAWLVEQATIEAIKNKTPYTVIGYDNGALVACIDTPRGRFWTTM